ncbi:hypothetical protein VTN77DRAFT_2589 [Rasamsonia byssochlamydoides]|uniref:uncharacterized protein n=1 Tax=Rasamsonia byssochlamydoides TaxID=89139 RepID=UPI003742B1A2
MVPSTTPKLPPYRKVGSFVCSSFTKITIHCNCKIFTITLDLQDEAIRGTRLETEYRRRVSKFVADNEPIRQPRKRNVLKDEENYNKFCEWIVQACVPLIQELAPSPCEKGEGEEESITLEQFAFPDLHFIKLGPRDGNDKLLSASLVTDVPEVPKEDRTIPFRTIPISALGDDLVGQVKLVSAAEISIPSTPVPRKEILDGGYVLNYHNTCHTPRLVRTLDGENKFFKPINNEDRSAASFIREITVLHRIAESGLHADLRVPKLYSIVVSSDGKIVIGMLQDWLSFGLRSLEDDEIRGMKNMHAKWEEQVKDMINVLHSNDMVWNCVLPEHILVDHELNAWLIGFSGPSWTQYSSAPLAMCADEWRKLLKYGNKEWDLYGVKKIFGELSREKPKRPARPSKKRAREGRGEYPVPR